MFNRSKYRRSFRVDSRSRALSRASVQTLESRQLLAAVSWDGGAATSNWTDALNWSTNVLPQPGDDVTIDVVTNPTINLNGANAVINSLTNAENLNLNSGTLSLATTSTSGAFATITQSGATRNGAGNFTINGTYNFNSGVLGGTGQTLTTGTVTIGSGGAYTSINDSHVLRIGGSANLINASGYNTGINGNAILQIGSNGTLSLNGNALLESSGSGVVLINAGGELTRSAPGTSTVSAAVVNNGTISAFGTATVNLNRSDTVGGTFSGSGTIQIYGGTHTFLNATTAASVTFNQVGGTMDGAGTLTASGPVNLINGVLQGTGTISLRATSTIGSGGSYVTLLGSRIVRVDAGTTTVNTAGGYNVSVAANARIAVGSGGTLAVGSASQQGIIEPSGAAGALNVEPGGVLTRGSATGSGTINIPVNNNGTVTATAGTLSLNGGGTVATGSFTPAAGTTVSLGGNWAYSDGTSVAGAGTTALAAGTHTVNLGAAPAAINVANGATLAIAGGTVTGAGATNVNGGAVYAFRSGILQGTGTTTVFGAATLGASNAYTVIQGTHTLRIRGSAVFGIGSGYNLSIGAGAKLVAGSGSTLDLTSTGDLSVIPVSGANIGSLVVEPGGTFTRTGAGIEYVDVPVVNTGGSITAATGAILAINAGSTHAAGSTFGGPGVVRLRNGTHSIDGATSVAVGGNLELNSGSATLSGASTLTVNGAIALIEGTMAGSATTLVAGTATVGSGSGYINLRDTHQLRVTGTATHASSGGYHVEVATNARIAVASGGTYNFGATNTDMRLVPAGGALGTGLLVIESGGTLTRTYVGAGENVELPVQNSGTIRAVAGADLGIAAGSTQLAGATIAGPGRVFFNGGTHTISGAASVASGGTLLQTNGVTLDGAATLTVDGTFLMQGGTQTGTGTTLIRSTSSVLGSGAAYVVLSGSRAIRIEGKLTLATNGGYDVSLGTNARIAVANGGTFDFGATNTDMRLVGIAAADTGLLVVETGGTLTRTFVGTGDSIDLPVQNSGTIRAVAGADLGLAAGSTQLAGATIAGPGRVFFNGGTHTVSGATTVATGGTLIHATSTLNGNGTLTVDGTYNFNSGSTSGAGTTILRGTTSTLGTGSGYTTVLDTRTIRIEGTVNVNIAGGYDMRLASGASIVIPAGGNLVLGNGTSIEGVAAGNIGSIVVQPNGTLSRSVAGNATVSATLNNTGFVRIDAGQINFSGATNADDGAFLSGGRYLVNSGGNLAFSPGLTTLTADVELSGTGTAGGLSALAINRGRIGLTNGADLSVDPAAATRFRLEGILDLSPTSVFTAVGGMDLGGTSQPIVRSEISSATDFGKVVITGGSLNLNSPDSTSRFDPDLVGGYNPAIGTQFAILTAPTRLNSFDSIQGGLTPSNNVIGAYTNGTTYGAQIIPGPAPAAPQILSTAYEFETRQAVTFNFDQDVSAFLSRKDYTIMNLTTGLPLPQSAGTLTFNAASNQATLLLTNEMPDGNYRLTVNASDIANASGTPASGAPIVIDFFVLAGDANGDRRVNFTDLVILAQNYNQSGKTFSQGNFNYSPDGKVDFADLVLLARRYNTSLSLPAATMTSVSIVTKLRERQPAFELL